VRFWLLCLALAAAACSSNGTWRRIETPHFILRTDLNQSEAKRAGIALETTRDALVSAAWPTFPFAPEKAEVYVLANGLDFERYFGKSTHGLFTRDKPARFFLYGSAKRWELRRTAHRPTPSVLRHEMIHQLGSEVLPHQPRWYSEGWAQFLEPIYYSDDQKHVVVGGINHEALFWYRTIRTTKLADALEWTERPATRAERAVKGLYGISWLFVHWLYHRHPDELRRFVDELSQGQSPDHALQTAMPNFDPTAADRELFQYQKYLRFARFDQNLRPLVETPVSESSLEEHLLDAREVGEVEELLAAVGQAHTGRSDRGDPPTEVERNEPSRTTRAEYAALPMLPQYPCGPEERANAPWATGSPAGDSSAPTSRTNVPAEVMERVIRAADKELRACYDEGLAKDASLGGKITFSFLIAEDRNVRDLRTVCTSLPDAEVVSCMAARFSQLQFPRWRSGRLTVVFPILFSPSD
jgi:hypothetical protein